MMVAERPTADAWAGWTRAATLHVSAEARELEDGTRAIRVVAGVPSAPFAEGWSRRDADAEDAPSLSEALRQLADELDAREADSEDASRVVATMRARAFVEPRGGRRGRTP